jgi:orotate phosphoribosyltransferase
MTDFRQDFIRFAAAQRALLFGEFVLKSGRTSPYFFNAGVFASGAVLDQLCEFYAKAIRAAALQFDVLFGSAYKGIPLAAGTAMCMARSGTDVPFSYNRKEVKDHGEGGVVIGAQLRGRVLIIDDVISAGTSVRESVTIIRTLGAAPCGVVIALDRMERGQGELSAVQEVEQTYAIPVISIASLEDLVVYLRNDAAAEKYLAPVLAYRTRYGVTRSAA